VRAARERRKLRSKSCGATGRYATPRYTPAIRAAFVAYVSCLARLVLAALVAGVSCVTPAPALAQDDASRPPEAATGESQPAVLSPVVVTATRSPVPLADVPASISVVEKPDIQDARSTTSLQESLVRVPGVLVQSSDNFAQDERIQIRGFGTRSAFGIREIRVMVDGLPETLPDGQTELDAIDMGAVDRVEVMRGPAAALYGNASGGLVQLFTEDAPASPQGELRVTAGSYGLQKYQMKAGTQAGRASIFAHSSFFELDGFRDHSHARTRTVTAKLGYAFSDDADLKVLISAVDAPEAQDPGALTRAESDASPRRANALNESQKAGEDVDQARVGIIGRRKIGPGEVSAYGYVLQRDFSNRLPIPADTPPIQGGVVTFERTSPGMGAQYAFTSPLFGLPHRTTLGFDVQHQDDDRRRSSNVNGEPGELGLIQQERVTSVGPYVRDAVEIRDDLELSFGIRYDRVYYDVDVDFPIDSTASGSRTLEAWSPAGGLRYSPLPWLSAWAAVGTAFQSPTTTELANPAGGGFNDDLDPQHATSYELGVRAERERGRAEIVGFVVDVDDELVPFELASQPGRTFFRNAGRSLRYGMELAWEVSPWRRLPWRGVRWTSSLSAMEAEYRDYATPGGVFDGNEEPGIPDWQLYEEISYRHANGVFAAVESFTVGDYFVDDANTVRAHAYTLVNVRAGYTYERGRFSVEPFLGLRNLLDQDYDARVRLNAQNGRYFEPGPGLSVYGGLAVTLTP
jgi:iron complex outermembrane receptor protein